MESIHNSKSNTVITGTANNDFISNYCAASVSINAGDGNDSIRNDGEYNSESNNVTIDGGAGNDTIRNELFSDFVQINAGVGDDSIDNSVNDNVTINAGDGDDAIYNNGNSVSINAGAGNDSIYNYHSGDNVTIDGGAGDDSVDSRGDSVIINGGVGNDSIYNHGDSVNIDAGAGNDSIINGGEYAKRTNNVTIYGGAGNDYIKNFYGDSASVNGGLGDDSIFGGSNSKIDGGDGNDYISGGSNSTIYGGAGDDYISGSSDSTIYGGTGNDSIDNYSESVKIDAGAGDDYIKNRNDYVSINASAGEDTIYNNGDSVKIDAGDGNDSIYNDYGNYYYRGGSNITINAGEGDDYIYNNGNSVSINAGAGNDSIYNDYGNYVSIYAGGGNNYIENYGKNVTIDVSRGNNTIENKSEDENVNIAVGSYTSVYSGNDILLTTKTGSVLVKDGKDFTINGGIHIVHVEDESDTQIDGNDNIENTSDNQTIYGTNNEDALYNNGGNNVLIYGLAGNDKIGNNYTAKGNNGSFSIYCGKNVSLNGGTGDDEIYSYSPTDNIIYATGDGDDTIFAYYSENDFKNGESLKIHLTSGTFKGAKLDSRYHSNLVISLGNGTITLKTSNGLAANKIPITVVDSNGKEFKFTGEYEVAAFAYSATSGETHTATNHSNYSGELVTGKNGEAFIEQGDTIKTDSSGNISEIIISNKNHRITTPLNRSTQKNVVVKDSAGNTIATIKYGVTEIYWDGKGYIIDAVDKNAPISVESNMDNVKIIGSNRADNITSNGKNAVIDSGLGNDTVTNNNATSTIIGGKDNDTINGYGENIKLTVGSVKNASLKGSDVIITTSRDSVITVKNGKGKNINIITGKDKKLSFTLSNASNTYGDPEVFIEEAENLANTARNELEQELAGVLETTANTTNKESLDNLKKCFSMVPGSKSKLSELPDSVFNQIVNDIYNRSDASKIKNFNIFKPETWVYTVAESVSTLGAKEFSFGGYNISINSLIALGAGEAYITVTNGSKKWEITYQSSKEQLTEAISNYAMVLNKLNQDAWWNVVTGLVTDITGTKKAGKYLTYAKNIVSALVDPNGKLSDEIKSVVKKETNLTIDGSALRDFIKNYVPAPYNDIILEAADAYKEISLLKSNITADKSFKENADVYDDLNIAYSAFKVALNGTKVSAPQISSFGFSGLFSALGSSAFENINNNDITYVDSSGATVSSGTKAVGKFETNGKTLTYTALNSEAQDVNLGSMFDTNDWNINTSDKSDKIIISSNKNTTIVSGKGNDSVIVDGTGDVLVDAGSGDDVVRIANSAKSIMTVNGGSGNDTIYSNNGSNVFVYKNGDGNDVIYDYSEYNEIQISGSSYSTTTNGEDIIIQVGNGSINLVDAKNMSLNIKGTISGGEEDILPTGISISNSILTASSKFTGNKIDLSDYKTATKVDVSELSKGVSVVGSSAANSIKGGSGADTISGNAGNDTVSLGGGSDVYVYSSGNDLIQDYTSGQDKIKLSSVSISSASVSNNNVILNISNGGKITIQNGKNREITVIDSKGNETTQIYPADDIPEPTDSLPTGMSVKSSVLTASTQFKGNKIDLEDYTNATKVNVSAVSQALTINGNSSSNSIKGGKGSDTINGGSANDTLAGGTGKDLFVYSSGDDVITDYKPNEDKIKLNLSAITKSSVKGSDVILTTSNGSLTVKATKDKVITFVDNNGKTSERIFFANTSYAPLETGLAYDAKRVVLTASNKFTGNKIDLGEYLGTVTKLNSSATSQNFNIIGNSADNSIKGGKSADTITGGTGKDTISGGTGNDSLYGGSDNDKLLGEAGNDTLNGGTGNDTLTGGAGNDVFVYEGGNDLITDYKPNEDKIRLNLSAIISSSVKGSDVILTTSNGTLTVKGTKDKIITFVDNNGKTSERIFFANTSYAPLETGLAYDAKRVVLTASNKFTGNKIDLGEYLGTVTKLNSSATSQNFNIIGNSADNSIKAGKGADTISGGNGKDSIFGGTGNDSLYGGSDNDKLQGDTGNDTLNGGLGNDTLTGGAGNDVFVYEGGNDVITDYKLNEDKIKLLGTTVTASSLSGSNVILKTSSGNITVQNGKNKKITVIDSSGAETTQIYPTDNLNPSPISTLPNGWKYDNNAQTNIIASVSSAANVDLTQSYGTSIVTVDGSKVTKNISITGNEKANLIKGGSGADTIYGNAGADIIYGGSGGDKLYGDSGDDSLYGGTGNDTLVGGPGNDVYIYNDGDGNDVIESFDSQSTLKILGNGYSTIKSDNDIIVKVGNGNISLIGAASLPVNIVGTLLGGNTDEIGKNIENQISNTLISGTTGNDSIVNFGYYYTTINAGEGDDTVYNYGRYTTIDAGNGNDYVHIQSEDSKVNTGEGNDTIYERGYNSTIYGGDGDDSIFSEGNRYDRYMNLIDAGKGNDTISLDSSLSDNLITHLITYSQGDGNDTIYGYNANDTIHITSGSFSTLKSGNDFIIKVGSNGSITLKDALTDENSKVRIKNSSGNIIMYGEDSDDWSIMSGTNGDDTLNNTLNGVAIYAYDGNNSINNIANYTTIIGGNGSDTIDNDGLYVSINAGSGNDSISNYVYKGIVSDVTINGGDGNDIISNKADYVIIYGGTGNDKIYNGGFEHGNFSTIYSGEGNDSIYMDFYSCGSYVDGGVGNDYVSLSGCNNLVINGGDGDDNIYSQKGVYASKDIVVSGGKGNDKITFGGKYSYNWLVQYYSGDGNDTIWGMDDNDTLQIIGTTYSTITQGNDLIVNVDNDHILLKDAATIDINIENLLYNIDNQGEYIMVSQRDDTIKGTSKNDIFINYAEKVSINSGSGDDIIYNKDANASIDAGKGNDYIHNEGYTVILNAGEGNDTINGQWQSSKIMSGNGNDYIAISGYNNFNNLIDSGAGNDKIVFYRNKYKYDEYSENNTIKGGIGDDFVSIVGSNDGDTEYSIFYQYSEGDGNDVIYGINGTETLQISGAKYTTTKSGNDLIIGVGTGSISVVGGANVDFTIDVNHKNEIFDNANKCICDLIYDNNFVTDDFVIDDISEVTETNYSVGKLEYSSNNNELANNSIVSAAYFDEK